MGLRMLDGNDLPHKFLLTARQKKRRSAFNNNMSTNLKLSRAPIFKIVRSGGFLRSLLSKLTGPLMKVAIPLAKNILVPLKITAAASAIDARIQNNMHGFGTTPLIISNKEMNDVMEILQDCNILLKKATKTIKNETKEQKGGFLSMLLRTSGASLLENLSSRKGIIRADSGNKNGKVILRAGYRNKMHF